MTTSSNSPGPSKVAVCIKEMAEMVGLSRQRFMQLVKAGVMPAPLRDEASGRPYYPEDLQARCAEVRRRNVGINGRVVMFYARRTPVAASRPKAAKAARPSSGAGEKYADVVAGLHALGLTSATTAQVAEAVADLFPGGDADTGTMIRSVFLHLRSKNPTGNVGSKQ